VYWRYHAIGCGGEKAKEQVLALLGCLLGAARSVPSALVSSKCKQRPLIVECEPDPDLFARHPVRSAGGLAEAGDWDDAACRPQPGGQLAR